jgi:Gpi18-like mannosyltransferase
MLVVGTLVRIALIDARGHGGDLIVNTRWAESLAQAGPWGFYGIDRSVYPALLYLLWPVGVLFDGDALNTVVKGMSIPFDLGLGIVLFFGLRRVIGDWRAAATAGLYLFNPGVLIGGPMWGQVDAAGTLPFVATLLLLGRSRFGWAGAMAMLALLVKPQYGLVGLPVLVVAGWHLVEQRDVRPLLRAAVAGIATYALVAIPLRLDPFLYWDLVSGAAARQPMTSLFAPNPWGLFTGYDQPDGGLAVVGGLLLLIGLAMSQIRLLWHRDTLTLIGVGLQVVFAFYFLPTRVHERYLFPAMALAAPFAALQLRSLLPYLLLSSAFALSLIQALLQITGWRLGEPLQSFLVSSPLTWIAGLALLAAAAALVLFEPPAPSPGPAGSARMRRIAGGVSDVPP